MKVGNSVFRWHPDIHRIYSETLYFFALRFRGYSKALVSELVAELAERHGITGLSAYEVFGAFDVILKVWLTPASLPVISSVLASRGALAAFPVFRVEEMRAWPFGDRLEEKLLRELPRNGLDVERIQKRIAEGEVPPEVDELTKRGIAHVFHAEKGVRFFSALRFEEALNVNQERFVKSQLFDLHDAPSDRIGTLRNCSVYWGQGFGKVFVEGMTDDIVGVREGFVESVVRKLAGMFPEITTFTICQSDPHEDDRIGRDALGQFSAGKPAGWIEQWFPDIIAASRDAETYMAVQNVLEQHRSEIEVLSDDRKRNLIAPLARAVLTGDRDEVVRTLLPWFARVEADLHSDKMWFGFLRALLGKSEKDISTVNCSLRDSLGLGKEKGKFIALGDQLNLYIQAIKELDPDSHLLKLNPRPAEVTQIRNEFAHGAFFDEMRFVSRWKEILSLLLQFIPLYDAIQRRSAAGMEG